MAEHNEHRVIELLETEQLLNRIDNVYDRLVDETENPETYHNKIKTEKLHALLDILEYIKNNVDNPLDEIFWKES